MEPLKEKSIIMESEQTKMTNDGLSQLAADEGFEGMPYDDHLGKPTIGYGTLLPLTPEEGKMLLESRLQAKTDELLASVPEVATYPAGVRDALFNMAYQLGTAGLLRFRNMWAALDRGFYDQAADEALDSLWARQTPNRAERVAAAIRKGE